MRSLAEESCEAAGIESRVPPLKLCTDNGAMTAAVRELLVPAGAEPAPPARSPSRPRHHPEPSVCTAEIRRRFLDVHAERGHTVVPSAPLPTPDPTLLVVNAGVVPFKPYPTGETAAPWPRATNVRKCVRTRRTAELPDEASTISTRSTSGPVLDRAAALAGVRYGADAEADVRLRVAADHVRTATPPRKST